MCPKKAKTTMQVRLDVLGKLLIELAKDVEKFSDKNTINTASTAAKQGKGKGSLKGKSEKKSETN